MGMEAVFFARINEDDFQRRKEEQDLQFIWTPQPTRLPISEENGEVTSELNEIFAHVLFSRYGPPNDVSDDDWLLNKYYTSGSALIPKHQAWLMAPHWVKYFEKQLRAYRTNQVLVLWGDDFAHFDANLTFNALDFIQDNI